MTDAERIERRLAAVERALVDGDGTPEELSDLAAVADRVERLESRLEEHERRLGTLQGTFQSLEGFVGNVRSVNDDVERRADAAIATVDRLERRLDRLERVREFETDESSASIDGATAARSSDSTPAADAPGSAEPARNSSPLAPFAICSSTGADDRATDRAEDAVAELFSSLESEPVLDGTEGDEAVVPDEGSAAANSAEPAAGTPGTDRSSTERCSGDRTSETATGRDRRGATDRPGEPSRGVLGTLLSKLPS